MGILLDSVRAFEKLLDVAYTFVIARKGKTVTVRVVFHKNHFFHLAGLHYLTDIQSLRGDREKLFDKISQEKITEAEIQKSKFFGKIEQRLKLLANLESYFDSNDIIFHYNEKVNNFSVIKADYLLENSDGETTIFTFLAKNPDKDFFCRSFFPKADKDYTIGQTKWTLLRKEKTTLSTGESVVQYEKIYQSNSNSSFPFGQNT